MKKALLVLIIAVIFILGILAYFLISNKQLSPASLATCNTLSYNSQQAKNIVFFSSKEQAQEYSTYLLSQHPFSKNKQAFNFYYIDTYTPSCELYKNIAILCYNKELVQQASSCPNDYIITIDTKPSNIRSSSYMNTLSINSAHSKTVLLHELGHALAFLADEYVPSTLPLKSKNCVSDCKSFSVSDGCFEGCSNNNYYRSIQSSVMRTLSSSEYGSLNNQLILSQLPSASQIITGKPTQEFSDCSQEKYYLIEGKLEPNKITILSQNIEQGCVGSNGVGDFDYKLIMQDGSISTSEFNPELIFTDNQETGSVEISERPFYLKIPIIEQAKTLEISKNQQTLAQINLLGLDARPCRK